MGDDGSMPVMTGMGKGAPRKRLVIINSFAFSPKPVMADLIRHLLSARADFWDRRSRVKRGMTEVGAEIYLPIIPVPHPFIYFFTKYRSDN